MTTTITQVPRRIAAAVDFDPAGQDAAALAAALARAVEAEQLMLVSVDPQPLVVLEHEMSWKRVQAHTRAMLARTRDRFYPEARLCTELDHSVGRALERVITRDHHDLLVIGSSRHAQLGHVRIGGHARQLLEHGDSALAIAPLGYREHPASELRTIGVGHSGSPEDDRTLEYAASLAAATGAVLSVYGVVNDRLPVVAMGRAVDGGAAGWEQTVTAETEGLGEQLRAAIRATEVPAECHISRGRPSAVLCEAAADLDLMIIGSRRWGLVARVLLGSTGEALAQHLATPLLLVPRAVA